jgi:hypothetical protein
MLFKKKILEGIQNGSVTLAYRRWRRPTVREGGTLLTPVGELSIGSVSTVSLVSISAADAGLAGYESRDALLAELTRRAEGEFYRIELGSLGPDPRIRLRDLPATGDEFQTIQKKLQRLDSYPGVRAWTLRVLEVLSSHPGVRAGDLCCLVDQEKDQFKRNVRKLKNLGLTESLGIGYRLSRRGQALLDALRLDGERG